MCDPQYGGGELTCTNWGEKNHMSIKHDSLKSQSTKKCHRGITIDFSVGLGANVYEFRGLKQLIFHKT